MFQKLMYTWLLVTYGIFGIILAHWQEKRVTIKCIRALVFFL